MQRLLLILSLSFLLSSESISSKLLIADTLQAHPNHSLEINISSQKPENMSQSAVEVLLNGERIMQSSPAHADFDGDGDHEIVVGGRDGVLHVVAYDGANWTEVWSHQTATDLMGAGAPAGCGNTTQSDFSSAPTIADLDNDGKLEIVVTTGADPQRNDPHRNGGVLIYEYESLGNFTLVPNWPQPKQDIMGQGPGASEPDGCWDGIWGSAAVGDLDNDGDQEVVVVGFDRRIHAWHHDGSYVAGWPIDSNDGITRGGWSTPALADIDKDGFLEVIAGTDNFRGENRTAPFLLFVFEHDSSIRAGFPVETSQNIQSSPAIGDINNDGNLDIVVGTGTDQAGVQNYVYAWDAQGQPLAGWPQPTQGNMPASPALGDLDNDGDLEVVIGCGDESDAKCPFLYAFHGDGSNVNGFPAIPPSPNEWDIEPNLTNSPILADYDGDGAVEILVVPNGAWGIAIVNNQGQGEGKLWPANDVIYSSPAVADVDQDGKLEVVIGGANSGATQGMLFIWDVEGAADSALPWPAFHQNMLRTGIASIGEEPVPPTAVPPTVVPSSTVVPPTVAPTSVAVTPDPTDTPMPSVTPVPTEVVGTSAKITMTVSLNGVVEVPDAGDPDGTGTVVLVFDAEADEVCYTLETENIDTPTAGHIHEGASGVAGGVAIALFTESANAAQGCVTATSRSTNHLHSIAVDTIIDTILTNPSGYYVNIHNAEFSAGAIRGQLATARPTAIPETSEPTWFSFLPFIGR